MTEQTDTVAKVLREWLTCRNGASHYCPNCDNSIDADRIIAAVRAASPAGASLAALQEIAKHLSPGNENVRRGYLVACIRDLAQVALSEKGNVIDTEQRLAEVTRERDEARTDVVRMAAATIGDKCEHHRLSVKELEWLMTKECPLCWKACAEQVEQRAEAAEATIASQLALLTEATGIMKLLDRAWKHDAVSDFIAKVSALAAPAAPDECSHHALFDGTCARGTFRCPDHYPVTLAAPAAGTPEKEKR